jgi:hypothetical protein
LASKRAVTSPQLMTLHQLHQTTILVLCSCRVAFCQSIDSQPNFRKADPQIVRLPPSRFPQLPTSIRNELARRNCTIPQVAEEKVRQNVIKGSFIEKGELDWAVLCSVHGNSSILIFRKPSAKRVIEVAREADTDRLQSGADGKTGYSRAISPVDRTFILEHYRAYGGPAPPPIDHQGIDDAFVGKASVVLYFYRGKWLQLAGAD